MGVKIGHASIDERGKSKAGMAGNQTGGEVCIREWYQKAWTHLLRPKEEVVANKIVKACKDACRNANIGYDQSQRTTLYTQAKETQYDLSKIEKKCECDCSSFVSVCVNAAGVRVSKDIYTGNMVKALNATDCFEILTDNKYLTSDKFLKAGDILVCKGHCVMVLENGSSSSMDANQQEDGTKYKVKITASLLNVRKGPGMNHSIVATVRKGEVYTIIGEAKNGSTIWGKLKSKAGYISLKYTKKC